MIWNPYTLANADFALTNESGWSETTPHFKLKTPVSDPQAIELHSMGYRKLRINFTLDSTVVPGLKLNDKVVFKLRGAGFDGSYTNTRLVVEENFGTAQNLVKIVPVVPPSNNHGAAVSVTFKMTHHSMMVGVECVFTDPDDYDENLGGWMNGIFMKGWDLIVLRPDTTYQTVWDSTGYWQRPGYVWGFQGQEKDDEIYGFGNAYAYTYRMNDVRLGRFWSVDPLQSKYPHNSPYAFSENVVINAVELEGLEKVDLNDNKVDGVTVQLEGTKTYASDGSYSRETTITNNDINGAGQVTGSTLAGTITGNGGLSSQAQQVQSAINSGQLGTATWQQAWNQLNNGNSASGDTKATIPIQNQFNQAYSFTNVDGAGNPTNTPPNFQNDVTNSINNGNSFVATLPNNVSRVLVLTNSNANAISNAVNQVALLQSQHPNIQFSVGTTNVFDGTPGANGKVGIVFNPTANFAAGVTTGIIQPFITPMIPVAPIIPLTRP